MFADADDYFNPCLNEVLDDYKNDDRFDIVFFKSNSVFTNTYLPAKRHCLINKWNDECQNNPAKGELSLRFRFGGPVCKLINRAMLAVLSLLTVTDDDHILIDSYITR